jgi:hypothetical protein
MSQERILEDPEDFQRQHLFLYNLMYHLNRCLTRLSRYPDPRPRRGTPWTILLLPSLVIMAVGLVSVLVLGQNLPQDIWLYLYLGLSLFAVLVAAETINCQVVRTLTRLNMEIFRLERTWSYFSRDVRYQGWIGIDWAIFSAGIMITLYQDVYGESMPLLGILFTLITGFVWGLSIYISITSSLRLGRLLSNLDIEQLPLYSFNPQQSPFISRVSELYEQALWICSITVVILLFPVIIVPKTPLVILAGWTFSIGGAVVLVGLFFLAQQRLNQLVSRKKQNVLTALQQRIEAFYQKAERLDKDTYAELENLVTLHDKVANSSSQGISAFRVTRFLSSFILPGTGSTKWDQ